MEAKRYWGNFTVVTCNGKLRGGGGGREGKIKYYVH